MIRGCAARYGCVTLNPKGAFSRSMEQRHARPGGSATARSQQTRKHGQISRDRGQRCAGDCRADRGVVWLCWSRPPDTTVADRAKSRRTMGRSNSVVSGHTFLRRCRWIGESNYR